MDAGPWDSGQVTERRSQVLGSCELRLSYEQHNCLHHTHSTKVRKVKKLTIKQKDEMLQVSGVFGDPPRGLSRFGPRGLEVLVAAGRQLCFPSGSLGEGPSIPLEHRTGLGDLQG